MSKIVRGYAYSEKDELALLASLKELLGFEMDVKVEYVDRIHSESSFKKRFVINELGKDYIEKALIGYEI